MKNTSVTHFEVLHNSFQIGANGRYTYESETEAISFALKFKKNPKIIDKDMPEETATYWKEAVFVISKKTVKTQEIRTI